MLFPHKRKIISTSFRFQLSSVVIGSGRLHLALDIRFRLADMIRTRQRIHSIHFGDFLWIVYECSRVWGLKCISGSELWEKMSTNGVAPFEWMKKIKIVRIRACVGTFPRITDKHSNAFIGIYCVLLLLYVVQFFFKRKNTYRYSDQPK